MSVTVVDPVAEMRLRHLAKGNQVRTGRALLKRQIAAGEKTVVGVLADIPPEAVSWRIGELLVTQRQWGVSRMRKFLAVAQVGEMRKLGALTDRQRRVLARMLEVRNG